jgi:hypothetical protein
VPVAVTVVTTAPASASASVTSWVLTQVAIAPGAVVAGEHAASAVSPDSVTVPVFVAWTV